MSKRNQGGTAVEPGAELALERTELALEAAERAELALAEATSGKGGGRLRKLLFLLVVGAVVAIVIKKLTAQDASTTAPAAPTSTPPGTPGEVSASGATTVGSARNGDQPDLRSGDATQAAAASEDSAS